MHKYWSRKPGDRVARYIEQHSKPGEIVLDSFCGSGTTAIESVRLGRRAIGFDINPAATLITQLGLQRVDPLQLRDAFGALEREVRPTIDGLYAATCEKCGESSALITHVIWQDVRPHEVWYRCSICSERKLVRSGNARDLDAAMRPQLSALWHPATRLIENGRVNVGPTTSVQDLFTPRAVVALSHLYGAIDSIEQSFIRDTMRACFTGALGQASRMVFVVRRRGRATGAKSTSLPEVGSWVIGYWVPKEHFEINVWRCFENRFKRILRGKRQVLQVVGPDVVACNDFDSLAQSSSGYWVATGSATCLPIPDDSVDYVFIDPPHGNRIPYLELSLLWNAWLGHDCDWDNEIVVSDAPSRQKSLEDYGERLLCAMKEVRRVLKPGRHASLVFNSLDDDAWLTIVNTCAASGLPIREVEPLPYSTGSVVQDTRRNALRTDLVITCAKDGAVTPGPTVFCEAIDDLNDRVRALVVSSPEQLAPHQVIEKVIKEALPLGHVYRISDILAASEVASEGV